jgi:general stress protein 26
MLKHEIMGIIGSMIDDTHAAVLATVDKNCVPHIRWVTPGCIEERSGTIFMISAVNLAKIEQIRINPKAQMLFQTKSINRIITVEGTVNILDNPSIRSEVLECVGKHLHAFWKINNPENELVVLEMIIERATVYDPQKGTRISVDFRSGA